MNSRFLITCSIIIVSFIALHFLTKNSSSSNFIQVLDSSVFAKTKLKYKNKELRLRGFVKEGSVLLYENKADFSIEQNNEEVAIHYQGSEQLPDTFGDGAAVRVDGYYSTEKNKFIAHKIEAKCSSKYNAEQHNDTSYSIEK